MIEVENILSRAREAPLPSRLAMMDGVVLQALAARRASEIGSRPIGVATLAALVLGVAAAGVSAPSARAEQPSSPFAAEFTLAPSTLLDASR